jgi:dihydrodipicolinate synthase/N-acetylneuraminate lyase
MRYYRTIAEAAAPRPLFLYTLPALTHVSLSPELTRSLVDSIENLGGIKDSSGDAALLAHYVEIFRNRGHVFCGNDRLLLHSLRVGVSGFVTSGAGVTPEAYVRLWQAACSGDEGAAARAQDEIDGLVAAFQDGKHPGLFKAGLAVRGIPAGEAFPPLPLVTDDERHQIAAALAPYGRLAR